MPAADRTHVTVPAVVHALNVLRHLAKTEAALGVSAIARTLGLSPSSCFNLMKTLCAEGVVDFDAAAKTYRLGAGVQALAGARGATDALALIRPPLGVLATEFELASGCWRVTPAGRLVLVAFADSDTATRIHMTVGQRLPMLIGAMGRCVAAHSGPGPDALAQAYGQLRWAHPPTLARYQREVALAQRRGWALDDGDFMRGITTVAAAIVDGAGAVRYCLSSSMFQGQHDEAAIARIGARTLECARTLAGELFGRDASAAGAPLSPPAPPPRSSATPAARPRPTRAR